MQIIDTHLHLIDRAAVNYGWLKRAPALDRDFTYSLYAQEALRCGITNALHMEVDVDEPDIENETAHIRRLAAMPDNLLHGAISACRPENADFAAFLERQSANPFVRGFRRVLHVAPDGLSSGALFRENIKRLSAADRPFDLCVRAQQIPEALTLVDHCPQVQFILDHCGGAAFDHSQFDAWRGFIRDAARRPNLAVKISGLLAHADPSAWRLADLRPYVEHCLESFGFARAVWGSDWPVCTLGASLSTWLAATQALVAHCSLAEREAMFAGNARRIWRW